jgi:transcriptional regulator with XRE-family HTH domain
LDESKQPEPVDVVVGTRVRNARVARGLTQAALAEQLGVSFQQVQKYENGSNRISASRLVQIADTLNVSPVGFLEDLGAFNERKAGASASGQVPGAQALLSIYERLPPPMRLAVLQLAQSLIDGGSARPVRSAAPQRRQNGSVVAT